MVLFGMVCFSIGWLVCWIAHKPLREYVAEMHDYLQQIGRV